MTSVLFAPDSFKGSLTSVEVARALAEGWRRVRPADELLLTPLADGGEGTIAAIEAAGGWREMRAATVDPIGRPIDATWLRSDDGTRAVIEMAAASGLSRLTVNERDPLGATTTGTGLLIRAVLDAGPRTIVLGIGGSATSDGGAGILDALGGWVEADRIDLVGLDARLATVDLHVACDVTNPLLGPDGAAAVYGPQKGATPADVDLLDERLAAFASLLETATGRHERATAGAGAAGGVGFALLCLTDRFQSLTLEPGVDLIAGEVDLERKLAGADLVITGEGRIDAQTAFGKTALGVARRAQAAGVPCIAVGGGVEAAGVAALAEVGAEVRPVHLRPMPIAEAMAAGAAPLVACGQRLAEEATWLAA